LIAWLLACTPPEVDAAAPRAQETGVMLEAPALEAALAPEDIEPLIGAFLAQGFYLPFQVHGWFMGVFEDLEAGEGACPTRQVSETAPDRWVSYWSGPCSGETYALDGNWIIDVSRVETEGRLSFAAVELWSVTGTTIADGGGVSASGQAEVLWNQDGMAVRAMLTTLGAFVDPAGPPELQAGLRPAATFDGSWNPDEGYVGSLDGAMGSDDVALRFDGLTFTAGCSSPVGVLGVRDPSSGWWEIALGDDCTGCGALSFGGETRGEACPGAELQSSINERFRAAAERGG
jgi:hypothetical protein